MADDSQQETESFDVLHKLVCRFENAESDNHDKSYNVTDDEDLNEVNELMDEMSEFYNDSEETSTAIEESLAKSVKTSLRSKIPDSKFKEIKSEYKKSRKIRKLKIFKNQRKISVTGFTEKPATSGYNYNRNSAEGYNSNKTGNGKSRFLDKRNSFPNKRGRGGDSSTNQTIVSSTGIGYSGLNSARSALSSFMTINGHDSVGKNNLIYERNIPIKTFTTKIQFYMERVRSTKLLRYTRKEQFDVKADNFEMCFFIVFVDRTKVTVYSFIG
ncbi:unnamed protein product [Mytilus coruscus]|uniref:Uncharacterized protein n=1 Tax=Mytilus coruscus TaxID=42192 RepID=A0A6J8CH55_MYTCO|nr:unnamed protein product [Mytilus coruscus]